MAVSILVSIRIVQGLLHVSAVVVQITCNKMLMYSAETPANNLNTLC
jgi:hypothetical protein